MVLDRTFKLSPVQIMQLCTAYEFKNYENIVWLYALLSFKRRATYEEIVTEVHHLTHNAMSHSLMADFESSMLIALNQIYHVTSRMFISFFKGCL